MERSNNGKQREVGATQHLLGSFRTTSLLAHTLTKERRMPQHQLQKIDVGKGLLQEARTIKKQKAMVEVKGKPKLPPNPDKSVVKALANNLEPRQSEKGKKMISSQREERRFKHLEKLEECEKAMELQFENFQERANELKEGLKILITGSDAECETLMARLNDTNLLKREIGFVNNVWNKMNKQKAMREGELASLKTKLNNLKETQLRSDTSYYEDLINQLTTIAFILEPEVRELVAKLRDNEQAKYAAAFEVNEKFVEDMVVAQNERFEQLFQEWQERVYRFHSLKHDDALSKFKKTLNSPEFVNPQTRVGLIREMKEFQKSTYEKRKAMIEELRERRIDQLTASFVSEIETRMNDLNESAQNEMDERVDELARDMEQTNTEALHLLAQLRDFLTSNDARLEEGETFETIIEREATSLVDQRRDEGKALLMKTNNYLDQADTKMANTCKHIIVFMKKLGKLYDKKKTDLKKLEVDFQVRLAQAGDKSDDLVSQQEKVLDGKVVEMQQAIHHIELNEKLTECFDQLDEITKLFRSHNEEYVAITEEQPQHQEGFFDGMELQAVKLFKMHEAGAKEKIQELFQKQTEEKQKALEEEAKKKWEIEKIRKERKEAEEAAKNPEPVDTKKKAPAKGAPAKGGKAAEEKPPELNVPQLTVPQVQEMTSHSGITYVKELSTTQLAQLWDNTQALTEEEEQQKQKEEEEARALKEQQEAGEEGPPQSAEKSMGQEEEKEELVVEDEEEEKARLQREADEKLPPRDPDGELCVHQGLILTVDQVSDFLDLKLTSSLEWLHNFRKQKRDSLKVEIKNLVDDNVAELDENLRKHWPRKGKLEVEYYQERKGQITQHNKKYERHVRNTLERNAMHSQSFGILSDRFKARLDEFRGMHEGLQHQLQSGKNLAELQGMQRKEKKSIAELEKDAAQLTLEMEGLAQKETDFLLSRNEDLLKQSALFSNGGNYSVREVQWYRDQMNEINNMLAQTREKREKEIQAFQESVLEHIKEPHSQFQTEYARCVAQLAAKEGLGKVFGQPKRHAQEKTRAEMTKCEQAQSGLDSLLERLRKLCHAHNLEQTVHWGSQHQKVEKQSLTVQMRSTLVSLLRCIQHYGDYLEAFNFAQNPYTTLERITYIEERGKEIDLSQEEKAQDDAVKAEELQNLGILGFKPPGSQKYLPNIAQIEKSSKELCQKLYTGENAALLVGADRLPQYFVAYLEHVRSQAHQFRLNCIRSMREVALSVLELCETQVPQAVFGHLAMKFTIKINTFKDKKTEHFEHEKDKNAQLKTEHMRMLRPDLANPSFEEELKSLLGKEEERVKGYKEFIDDAQFQILENELSESGLFFKVYLNNLKALLKIYASLYNKGHFILLPGDEVSEKKHKNVKALYKEKNKMGDPNKKHIRVWKGFVKNPFNVDLFNLPNYAGLKPEGWAPPEFKSETPPPAPKDPKKSQAKQPAAASDTDEMLNESETPNTIHHKTLMRSRTEIFKRYVEKFQHNYEMIIEFYDEQRLEENKYQLNWCKVVSQLTGENYSTLPASVAPSPLP